MTRSPDEYVYPAEQVLKKDLTTLKNWSSNKRVDLFDEIDENAEEYEFSFYKDQQDVIAESQLDRDLEKIEAARAFLAAAMYEDSSSTKSEDQRVEQIPDDEIEWLIKYDSFRSTFMSMDEGQLEDLIKNREGDVHDFVEGEIAGQIELREELLDMRAEIRTSTTSYFVDEFDRFFNLADEAVCLYIQNHGLPNTVEGIVEAANVTAEASMDREAIEEEIEAKFDELSRQLHHDLRDREQALRAEMRRLEDQHVDGAEPSQLKAEMANIRSDVEALSERRREDLNELSERMAELQELETDLSDRIDKLERERKSTIEELKAETKDYASSLLDDELERLQSRRKELADRIDQLRMEQEQRQASQDRFEDELQSLEEKLEGEISTIRESFQEGDATREGQAIRAELARLYELDYIGRFSTSVEEADTIVLPGAESFQVPDGYWDDSTRNQSGNHLSVLQEELGEEAIEATDRYPVGRYSIYKIQTSGFIGWGSETKLVIEAVSKANLRAFGKNGFDAGPAGVEDLLDVVNEAEVRARTSDTPQLIAIASLTGWTDEVISLVQDEDQARAKFTDVSVCLVDLQANEYYFDESNPVVRENLELFRMEVDSERVRECVDLIKSEYVGDPSVRLIKRGRIAEKHDFKPEIVTQAFEEIEEAGIGEQGYPEGAKDLCLLVEQS